MIRVIVVFAIIMLAIIMLVLTLPISVIQNKKPSFVIKELPFEVATYETDIDDNFSFVGSWHDRYDDSNRGLYLANLDLLGRLQVTYYPQNGESKRNSFVYISPRPVIAYQTFSIDNHMILLGLYLGSDEERFFNITRIGYGNNFSDVTNLFSDVCDRFPHLSVTNLYPKQPISVNGGVENQLEQRIILNYDRGGESRLLLLNKYLGVGNEHTIIGVGMYEYFDEGNLASGKRILFCGGYGEYVYYQVIYNSMRDPSPEISNFESHGTPVLYRYRISDESIEKVWDMDKISLNINANKDIALVSEYDYNAPLFNSGKIISLKNKDKYFEIPGIESGSDIMQSQFISEKQLVFYTSKSLYFTDLEKDVLYAYSLDEVREIQLSTNGVLFTKNNQNNTLSYYSILFENIFEK